MPLPDKQHTIQRVKLHSVEIRRQINVRDYRKIRFAFTYSGDLIVVLARTFGALSIIFGSTPEITTEISVITELKTKVLVD
mgnify:CR=1 FL=1